MGIPMSIEPKSCEGKGFDIQIPMSIAPKSCKGEGFDMEIPMSIAPKSCKILRNPCFRLEIMIRAQSAMPPAAPPGWVWLKDWGRIGEESTENRQRIDRESTENRQRIDRESTENRHALRSTGEHLSLIHI